MIFPTPACFPIFSQNATASWSVGGSPNRTLVKYILSTITIGYGNINVSKNHWREGGGWTDCQPKKKMKTVICYQLALELALLYNPVAYNRMATDVKMQSFIKP